MRNFQGDHAVQADVLRFVHDAHPAAAEFLEDAVVGDGLPEEWLGVWHLAHILGCAKRQVNEEGQHERNSVDCCCDLACYRPAASP